MCGRYALSASRQEIVEEFAITVDAVANEDGSRVLPADWNIAPTKDIYIIRAQRQEEQAPPERELAIVSWGLIAPWSKNLTEAIRSQSMAINARSETVDVKPTFRAAFSRRRCLIPASGYYEWATEVGDFPAKQPFFIHSDTDGLLAFAGIYSEWSDETGRVCESAALITRPAVDSLAAIHDRMPVFLPADRYSRWLDPGLTDAKMVRELMEVEHPSAHLIAHPVSTRVNSVRNNGAELVTPIEVASEHLF